MAKDLNQAFNEISKSLEQIRLANMRDVEYYRSNDENFVDFFLLMSKKNKDQHLKAVFLANAKKDPTWVPKFKKIIDATMQPTIEFLNKVSTRCKAVPNIPGISEAEKQKCLDSIAEDIRIRFKILRIQDILRVSRDKSAAKNDEISKLYALLNNHKSTVQKIIESICVYPAQSELNSNFEEINKILEIVVLKNAAKRLLRYNAALLLDLKTLSEPHLNMVQTLNEIQAVIEDNTRKITEPERTGLKTYAIKIALAECYQKLSALDQNITLWCKERNRALKQQRKEELLREREEYSRAMLTVRKDELQQSVSLEDLAADRAIEDELAAIINAQNVAAQAKKSVIKEQKKAEFVAQQTNAVIAENEEESEQNTAPQLTNIILNKDYYNLLELIFDDSTAKNATIDFRKILALALKCGAKIQMNGDDTVFRFETEVGSDCCSIPKFNHHGHGRHKVLGVYIAILKETLKTSGITPETVQRKNTVEQNLRN